MKNKINNAKIVLISWWTKFKDLLMVSLNSSFREYLMKTIRSWGLVLTYQQFLILSISPISAAIVAQPYFESIHKSESRCIFIYLLGYFKDTKQAQGSQNTDPKRRTRLDRCPHHLKYTSHNYLRNQESSRISQLYECILCSLSFKWGDGLFLKISTT